MSRNCTICKHPGREDINAALLGADSLRKIAAQWSVSKTALLRHKAAHLPQTIVKAAAVKEKISGGKLLDRLTALNSETASILREARTADTKDNQLALKAITRAEKQLELERRLLAELNEDARVDLTVAPEWLALRTAILLALDLHPDAKTAVLKAMGSGLNNVAA